MSSMPRQNNSLKDDHLQEQHDLRMEEMGYTGIPNWQLQQYHYWYGAPDIEDIELKEDIEEGHCTDMPF